MKIAKKFWKLVDSNYFISEYKYHILFLAISIDIFLPGFFSSEVRDEWISPAVNIVTLISGLFIMNRLRSIGWYVVLFGLIGVIFSWFEGAFRHYGLLVFAAFICVLIYEMYTYLFKKDEIQLKEIIGALTGYMLIGYVGALVCIFINMGYENAFSNVPPGSLGVDDLLYFSYITMLTVGYGEITPLIPASRGVSIMLGLVGQFYLVVVIATFVGKFLMNTEKK